MRLEVDQNNIIRIFRDGEDFPFFEQPSWPDGTPWANHDEATSWGQQYLDWLLETADEPPLHPGT